ncbi:hypothetical protein LguiA_008580 [Lonicera macranthoides]
MSSSKRKARELEDPILSNDEAIVGHGRTSGFHWAKKEWGFARLLPLDFFKDSVNGYLINDTCVFGAEVLVVKNACTRHIVSMKEEKLINTFTWKIEHFSSIKEEMLFSEVFKVGDRQWEECFLEKAYFLCQIKCADGSFENLHLVESSFQGNSFSDKLSSQRNSFSERLSSQRNFYLENLLFREGLLLHLFVLSENKNSLEIFLLYRVIP